MGYVRGKCRGCKVAILVQETLQQAADPRHITVFLCEGCYPVSMGVRKDEPDEPEDI
jgi:hypothetical protein